MKVLESFSYRVVGYGGRNPLKSPLRRDGTIGAM